jgi:hypothetical protein
MGVTKFTHFKKMTDRISRFWAVFHKKYLGLGYAG